jgi:hypothetical protein
VIATEVATSRSSSFLTDEERAVMATDVTAAKRRGKKRSESTKRGIVNEFGENH